MNGEDWAEAHGRRVTVILLVQAGMVVLLVLVSSSKDMSEEN